MTQQATQMVTDLLSDEFEMLHNGEAVPIGISIFYDYEANAQVMEAMTRILDSALERMDPDQVYSEKRRHVGFLGQTGVMLTPSTLILVLFYATAPQRVLELNLSETGARLHFHK